MIYIIIIILILAVIGYQTLIKKVEGYDSWRSTPITLPTFKLPTLTIPESITSIFADGPVMTDKIMITGKPLLTIAQVLLYDDAGNQLQYGNYKNIQSSSKLMPYTTPDNALDTNIYFTNYPHVWHPSGSDANPWMSAELDSPKKIAKVVIYNRGDCCPDRINGSNIELYLNGKLVRLKSMDISQFNGGKAIITI
jgi:hypothetical protein